MKRSIVWQMLVPIPVICGVAIVGAMLTVPRMIDSGAVEGAIDGARSLSRPKPCAGKLTSFFGTFGPRRPPRAKAARGAVPPVLRQKMTRMCDRRQSHERNDTLYSTVLVIHALSGLFPKEEPMIAAKLRRIVGRSAIALALAIGIGAATMSPAHAEWHNGHWGHWGWNNGVRVFIAAPYPYGYYPYPYGYPYPYPYYAPGYYAPPPVVVAPTFGFGFTVGGHH